MTKLFGATLHQVIVIVSLLIPHSHQKLNCLRSGVGYSSTVSLSIYHGQLAPLLRQINFWWECGISHWSTYKPDNVTIFTVAVVVEWCCDSLNVDISGTI